MGDGVDVMEAMHVMDALDVMDAMGIDVRSNKTLVPRFLVPIPLIPEVLIPIPFILILVVFNSLIPNPLIVLFQTFHGRGKQTGRVRARTPQVIRK